MKEFIFTTGRNNVSPSKAIDYTKKAFTQQIIICDVKAF